MCDFLKLFFALSLCLFASILLLWHKFEHFCASREENEWKKIKWNKKSSQTIRNSRMHLCIEWRRGKARKKMPKQEEMCFNTVNWVLFRMWLPLVATEKRAEKTETERNKKIVKIYVKIVIWNSVQSDIVFYSPRLQFNEKKIERRGENMSEFCSAENRMRKRKKIRIFPTTKLPNVLSCSVFPCDVCRYIWANINWNKKRKKIWNAFSSMKVSTLHISRNKIIHLFLSLYLSHSFPILCFSNGRKLNSFRSISRW